MAQMAQMAQMGQTAQTAEMSAGFKYNIDIQGLAIKEKNFFAPFFGPRKHPPLSVAKNWQCL